MRETQLKQELKAEILRKITPRSDNNVKYIDLVFSGDDLEPSKTAVRNKLRGTRKYKLLVRSDLLHRRHICLHYKNKEQSGAFDYSIGNLTNIKSEWIRIYCW